MSAALRFVAPRLGAIGAGLFLVCCPDFGEVNDSVETESQPLNVNLDSFDSTAYFDVTISGNEEAFWDLGDKDLEGRFPVLASIVESTPAGVVAEVEVDCSFFDDYPFTMTTEESSDGTSIRDSETGYWFSGRCETSGGCTKTGELEFTLLEPVDGQEVQVYAEVYAVLYTTPAERVLPGAELTLTIEQR